MADNRRAFFELILGPESGYMTLAFLSARTRAWHEAFYSYPNAIDDALADVDKHLLTHNIYFCPTVLAEPKRVKASVHHSKVVWADLDTCHPSNMRVKPSLVLQTSPQRYQAYWFLNSVELATEVEVINKAIAYAHKDQGCDTSGWDLTQMLRVVSTKNHKYAGELHDVIIHDLDTSLKYDLSDFDVYEKVPGAELDEIPEMQSLEQWGSADQIWEQNRGQINPAAWNLFINEPSGSWSEKLWQLELFLFTGGLTREQVFIVANAAACNKYARDGRNPAFLWREVCRAESTAARPAHAPTINVGSADDDDDQEIVWSAPPILSDTERSYCANNPTFVEEYIEWAKTIGDAAWQYHQAGAFMILSTLLSGTVKLPTSFGTVQPNLWFMILADTTLTRKTTAMDMAMDLLFEIDPECVLATDGSIEGLLTSLSMRPGRPSIFLRDEFSGLLEMITKRDYYAGMLETLTKLYDGKFQKRVLRKETIEVRDPCLVIFAGGIKDRTLQLLTYEHVNSGFIPRFCFITAESDVTRLKPLGPPTEQTLDTRHNLISRMTAVHSHYNKPIGDSKFPIPVNWEAKLTQAAWRRYNEIEAMMLQSALDSNVPDLLTPTFDRLCKSGLKAAILLAASSRLADDVVVDESDLVRAFYYVEQWQAHTMYIVSNIGKSTNEAQYDRILDMIEKRPGITRSKIMQHFRLTAHQADVIFTTLEQRGLITRTKNGRGEKFQITGLAANRKVTLV